MTVSELDRFVNEIVKLSDKLREFFAESGGVPALGSKADLELHSFAKPGLIRTAHSQAKLLLNSADDYMNAFLKLVAPPINTLASWTVVRGAVEAAAISCWLWEPTIDALERVKRSYAYRHEGIEQERKLLNAAGKNSEATKSLQRLDELESEADLLGIARLRNKKRERIGIGMAMPKNTPLVEQMFGEEEPYRVLSAMAHSLPYATTRLAHRPMTPKSETVIKKTDYYEDMVFLEANFTVESLGMLTFWLTVAIARAAWS